MKAVTELRSLKNISRLPSCIVGIFCDQPSARCLHTMPVFAYVTVPAADPVLICARLGLATARLGDIIFLTCRWLPQTSLWHDSLLTASCKGVWPEGCKRSTRRHRMCWNCVLGNKIWYSIEANRWIAIVLIEPVFSCGSGNIFPKCLMTELRVDTAWSSGAPLENSARAAFYLWISHKFKPWAHCDTQQTVLEHGVNYAEHLRGGNLGTGVVIKNRAARFCVAYFATQHCVNWTYCKSGRLERTLWRLWGSWWMIEHKFGLNCFPRGSKCIVVFLNQTQLFFLKKVQNKKKRSPKLDFCVWSFWAMTKYVIRKSETKQGSG